MYLKGVNIGTRHGKTPLIYLPFKYILLNILYNMFTVFLTPFCLPGVPSPAKRYTNLQNLYY